MELPIIFGLPDSSITVSALILLAITVVFSVIIAVGFKRKHLGELC